MAVGGLVHQLDPNLINATTVRWIAMKFGTDIFIAYMTLMITWLFLYCNCKRWLIMHRSVFPPAALYCIDVSSSSPPLRNLTSLYRFPASLLRLTGPAREPENGALTIHGHYSPYRCKRSDRDGISKMVKRLFVISHISSKGILMSLRLRSSLVRQLGKLRYLLIYFLCDPHNQVNGETRHKLRREQLDARCDSRNAAL